MQQKPTEITTERGDRGKIVTSGTSASEKERTKGEVWHEDGLRGVNLQNATVSVLTGTGLKRAKEHD